MKAFLIISLFLQTLITNINGEVNTSRASKIIPTSKTIVKKTSFKSTTIALPTTLKKVDSKKKVPVTTTEAIRRTTVITQTNAPTTVATTKKAVRTTLTTTTKAGKTTRPITKMSISVSPAQPINEKITTIKRTKKPTAIPVKTTGKPAMTTKVKTTQKPTTPTKIKKTKKPTETTTIQTTQNPTTTTKVKNTAKPTTVTKLKNTAKPTTSTKIKKTEKPTKTTTIQTTQKPTTTTTIQTTQKPTTTTTIQTTQKPTTTTTIQTTQKPTTTTTIQTTQKPTTTTTIQTTQKPTTTTTIQTTQKPTTTTTIQTTQKPTTTTTIQTTQKPTTTTKVKKRTRKPTTRRKKTTTTKPPIVTAMRRVEGTCTENIHFLPCRTYCIALTPKLVDKKQKFPFVPIILGIIFGLLVLISIFLSLLLYRKLSGNKVVTSLEMAAMRRCTDESLKSVRKSDEESAKDKTENMKKGSTTDMHDPRHRMRHRKYILEQKRLEKSDGNSKKFKKKGAIFIPSEVRDADLIQKGNLPDNVLLNNVVYNEEDNEVYDIGSNIDDIELAPSTVTTLTTVENVSVEKTISKAAIKPVTSGNSKIKHVSGNSLRSARTQDEI